MEKAKILRVLFIIGLLLFTSVMGYRIGVSRSQDQHIESMAEGMTYAKTRMIEEAQEHGVTHIDTGEHPRVYLVPVQVDESQLDFSFGYF